jgi:hypothetical protein
MEPAIQVAALPDARDEPERDDCRS